MYQTTRFLIAGIITGSLLTMTNTSIGQTEAKAIPKTEVHFRTSDENLQKLYTIAEEKAKLNIVPQFGDYKVLVEGAEYKNVWLETQPMGGYMYGKRDLEVARNNIRIFMDNQREDGRLPGMLHYTNNKSSVYYNNLPGTTHCKDEKLIAYYGWFQGYCFPMPAFELYFWLNKDKEYLNQLYTSLEKFDQYLWKTRDSDKDGCLETWCVCDTGEDACVRFNGAPWAWPYDYAPSAEAIKKLTVDEQKQIGITAKNLDKIDSFPTPIESMDMMSYSYTGRDVLARISKELNNGKEKYWRSKANEVQAKMKSYLWDTKKHACFDRDKDNKTMNILIHNNLRCMYFGSFDQKMADEFVKYHLVNPKEFWTPMPLPSIAANDPSFRNISGNNWSGQPEGLTFQRSISALENYGHYAELSLIGQKFLKVVGDSLKFTQQFDPFTATITKNLDGYGPTALTSLEFISRMYGIHMTQDKVLWSCLANENQYDYAQVWGNRTFELTTREDKVFCSVNGKVVFSFTKGIRIVSDLDGKILEAVGIDTIDTKAEIIDHGNTLSLTIVPNTVYSYNGKFHQKKAVEFCKPIK